MRLFDHIKNNTSLRLIDDHNGIAYFVNDLQFINFNSNNKEIIFLYLDNSITAITVFLSVLRSDHCAVMLSPGLAEHFKAELETLYKPKFIFDYTRNEILGYDKHEIRSNSYFVSEVDNKYPVHQNIKLLLSTSGTTGSPKFVKLSEDNLISNATSILNYLPIKNTDITPLNLPVYYSYGMSVFTTNAIRGGKIVCGNDNVLQKDFWEKFTSLGYTSFAGVPFVYEMLDRIGFTRKTYPTLRYFTQAGGKLQDNLVKKFADYADANKIDFFVMYGQTEATARMSYLPPYQLQKKIGSIGVPIDNGKFTIDTETSELCYSGPNVFGGYVNEQADLKSYVQPNVLRTGDIARIDEDGFYFIIGRIKRFVKLFGNRINLDEVEVILSHRLNINAKCAGINDKQMIIFYTDEAYDKNKIIQFISTELSLHHSAIKVVFTPQLELTSNGKVDYHKMISIYGS